MRFRYLTHHYEYENAHNDYEHTLTHVSLTKREGYTVVCADIKPDSVFVVYRKER